MMRALWCGTIPGEPASKANKRRVFRMGTRMIFAKSAKALAYTESAVASLVGLKPPAPIECDVIMDCFVWYASRRPDLDESLVMDVLQKAGIIKNDRQIKEKHVYWRLDKENPRSLVTLSSMPA